jgi:urease accessory protein
MTILSRRTTRIALSSAMLIGYTGSASAHIVSTRLGDFYAGALHPLTDLQDVVLWAAVALLAASMGAARGKWLVLILPVGSLVGLIAAVSFGLAPMGVGPPSTLANAVMMLMLGVLIATAVRVPAPVVGVLAFGIAAMRGIVNSGGIAADTNLTLFAAGFTVAGYAVITLLLAVTVAFNEPARASARAAWRGIAIRVCGSWIAAIGLMMGAFALAS